MKWDDWCACTHIGYYHDGSWKLHTEAPCWCGDPKKPDEGACYSCKVNGKVCKGFSPKVA